MLFKCYFFYYSIAYMLINRTRFLYEIKDHNTLVIIKLVFECLTVF